MLHHFRSAQRARFRHFLTTEPCWADSGEVREDPQEGVWMTLAGAAAYLHYLEGLLAQVAWN